MHLHPQPLTYSSVNFLTLSWIVKSWYWTIGFSWWLGPLFFQIDSSPIYNKTFIIHPRWMYNVSFKPFFQTNFPTFVWIFNVWDYQINFLLVISHKRGALYRLRILAGVSFSFLKCDLDHRCFRLHLSFNNDALLAEANVIPNKL